MKPSLSVADSYSMPAAPLLKLFNANASEILLPELFSETAAYGSRPCSGALVVTLVNEVFYGRVFDVTLNADAAASLSAAVGEATVKSISIPTAAAIAATSGTAAASDAMAAARESAASAASGVAANLWSGKSTAITLRRSYQQPIAVGYRGVRLVYRWERDNPVIVGSVSSNDTASARPARSASGAAAGPQQ